MRIIADLKYACREGAFWDLLLPEGDTFDLLIWFHGGGLESGNRKDPPFAEDLTRHGIAVASVEYRMYPQAKFPDFIVDCADAVKYILDHIREYGEVNRILVSGQSAGAYITLMLALDEHYLADSGADRSRITAYISDSAQITTHYRVLGERGMDPRLERIDEAAPIYHLNAATSVRNLLLIAYKEDLPCRPEQNRLFFQSIRRFCPDQHIVLTELEGGHCNGSSNRNARGTFDFNDTLLSFLAGI